MHAPLTVAASRSHSRTHRRTHIPSLLALVVPLAIVFATGCASDAGTAVGPVTSSAQRSSPTARNAIVVASTAELIAALAPENAGRHILLRAGSYNLDRTLAIPDGVTLEGAGVMQSNHDGQPSGFRAATRTTLTMTANVPGDILTLGNGAAVRGLALEDLAGRAGNAIGVVSREAGDRVSATIDDVEITNPNAHSVGPQGPTGCGLAVLTLNPNLGADPAPHAAASVSATMTHTLIHSTAMGAGCGLFAFNFAPSAAVSVTLANNVIGGGIIASGGVSRPDAVHDSRTVIQSRRNLYRDDTADPCVAQRLGWNLQGGAGMPVPLPNPGALHNTLRMLSLDDRLEGFTTGVFAAGGRRFFAAPTAAPVSDNSVTLEMLGTTISTPKCDASVVVSDLQLMGALVANPSLTPGDGNTVRALILGVTGSGARANVFADVAGPSGPLTPALQGSGNRLVIVGSPRTFAHTNRAIVPAPGAQFFASARP